MATFLDVGLLAQFQAIFSWFLVWVIAFGLLEVWSPFGEGKKGLHSLIAVVLAFFVLFTANATTFLSIFLPWMVILAIAAFFLVFALSAFGHSPADIVSNTGKNARNTIMTFAAIILIFSLSGALSGGDDTVTPPVTNQTTADSALNPGGSDFANTGYAPQVQQEEDTFGDTLVRTITHPKMLGLIFLLLMANFTIAFLTRVS